ncbi:MAG: DUF1573 domain-containing protein [Bacteroidales bacterium]|nr:DUF1573 domain-containing protein [Bacteroidales bacterium]
MKKYLLFLMVLTISVLSCGQDKSTTENSEDKPEMIFNETDHNYGTIKYKGDGIYEFVYKNTGKVPLIIKRVDSSCGCTVPSWDKEPIAPNGKGKIVVKYDTNRIGSFIKSIKVFSNAENSPVELIIRGEVKVTD